MKRPIIRLKQTGAGDWYWALYAANNREVLRSMLTYPTMTEARRCAYITHRVMCHADFNYRQAVGRKLNIREAV
jgi:hypothetical protein